MKIDIQYIYAKVHLYISTPDVIFDQRIDLSMENYNCSISTKLFIKFLNVIRL